MIACDDLRGSGKRIGLTEHCVRDSNGEFADRVCMHHVTIVNHTDDLHGLTVDRLTDQNVVVIGIAMNTTCAQFR